MAGSLRVRAPPLLVPCEQNVKSYSQGSMRGDTTQPQQKSQSAADQGFRSVLVRPCPHVPSPGSIPDLRSLGCWPLSSSYDAGFAVRRKC